MRERRVLVVLPRTLSAVLAMGAAACDSATGPPPPAVRIEAITPISVTSAAGGEVEPAPAVRATDEHGSGVAGVTIEFQVAQGGGVIAKSAARTSADGSATVGKWTLGPAAGAQTLMASAAGLGDVRFTATAVAGPATRVTRVKGNDQIAGIGQSLSQPLIARVADSFGNPVAGAPVTFMVVAGGGSIGGGAVVTDSKGVATSGAWTLGGEGGVQRVSAASGAGQVTFQAFAIAPPSDLQGQIAFVSLADHSPDIAVVNADGTGFRRLARPGHEQQPAWSPDGSRIAFVSDRVDEGATIHIMTAEGANVARLTDGPRDRYPDWSPDGTTIAYSSLRDGSAQIAALDTVEGTVTLVTDLPGYEGQPSWSPDGRRLAFVSDYAAYDFVFDIYVMNADGTGQRRLTHGFDLGPRGIWYHLHPAWSPDGSMIAFVLGDFIKGGGAMRFRVALMTADGGFLTHLASAGEIAWNEVLDPGSLTWSPDGRGIAYSFVDMGVRSVKYVSLDGSREGTIVSNAHSPSWRR